MPARTRISSKISPPVWDRKAGVKTGRWQPLNLPPDLAAPRPRRNGLWNEVIRYLELIGQSAYLVDTQPAVTKNRECVHSLPTRIALTSVEALLPGSYAVGHAVKKIGLADPSLDAREPHLLSYFVAHTGEGEGDASALQLLDGV